ncbi:MAG: DUF2804 domain-containing protein [Eubacteriales bacterium]|nr:DUF2804 domain-containing protein [Eubacteriales bacterium]
MKKTYVGWQELGYKRNQVEYVDKTRLLDDGGNLLVKGGWARRNVFEYDRNLAVPHWRGKEWDFYQFGNGKYMVQISIANISIGGYASATLVDVSGKEKKTVSSMDLWLGGKNKPSHILPENGDRPNTVHYVNKNFEFFADTKETTRTVRFRGPSKDGFVETVFTMDLFENHENITIVTPFKKNGEYLPTRFFMTMKQNCMPACGYFKVGDEKIEFSKDDTFCVLDWGRGVWPYKSVWYWGNGATYLKDEDGKKHIFGFEITWGIGNEDNATETCLFYDGKAHKIGSVDVEVFPKPDKYMDKWRFVSEDGRFDMTMTPVYDHHSDTNVLDIARMHSHQVHGLWNGTVTLDDGKVLEIKDMYAFCEYVENKW